MEIFFRQPELHPAYQAIKSVSDKSQIIKAFHEDLTKHDKKSIEENPDSRFLWFIYRNGTHIYFLDNRKKNWLEAIFKSFPSTKNYAFFWDGSDLHHITADQAIKIQYKPNIGA